MSVRLLSEIQPGAPEDYGTPEPVAETPGEFSDSAFERVFEDAWSKVEPTLDDAPVAPARIWTKS